MITKNEVHQLAKLLVKYHNSITPDNASFYGEKMDKALISDLMSTLFRHGDYNTIFPLKNKIRKYEPNNAHKMQVVEESLKG